MGPMEVRAEPGYRANEVRDVLGQNFNAMLQAHMVSVNGIGIELFQLLDPPHERREPSLEYWKSGFFHICVTDPNIEELAGRIASSGGRQRSKIWRIDSRTEDYRLCYCEDPFGRLQDKNKLIFLPLRKCWRDSRFLKANLFQKSFDTGSFLLYC